MSTNDPIDKILAKAAAFEKLANAPAKPLSPKLSAEVTAMFSKLVGPMENNAVHTLSSQELTSLLLIVISRRSASALELIDALKKQNFVFDAGYGTVFGLLQKLEKQGYVSATWQERGKRKLRSYSLTERGRFQIQEVSARENLNSLADDVSAAILLT